MTLARLVPKVGELGHTYDAPWMVDLVASTEKVTASFLRADSLSSGSSGTAAWQFTHSLFDRRAAAAKECVGKIELPFFSIEQDGILSLPKWTDVELKVPTAVSRLYGRVRPSILEVSDGGSGTAFVIDDQIAVTADHVIRNIESGRIGSKIVARMEDGSAHAARVIAHAPNEDVALLHIPTLGSHVPKIPVIKSDNLVSQEPVLTIGHPGNQPTASLSAGLHGNRELALSPNVPQDSARKPVAWLGNALPVLGGSSGGPIFNVSGQVVGLVSRANGGLRYRYSWGPASEYIDVLRGAAKNMPEKGYFRMQTEADISDSGKLSVKLIKRWKID